MQVTRNGDDPMHRATHAGRYIFAILITGIYLFTTPAWGQAFVTEDRKVLPNSSEANDNFGFAVAVENGIIVTGANGDDDNGMNVGAVYSFDASTGSQLRKFFASDGASGDFFGYAVDIDNGIIAVGAMSNDDNGDASGSAYLFDASTGAQLFKLLPDDGAATDLFGESIAIANGIVVVGARNNDDNGNNSGSAYLFNASTGTQIHKLLPNDGAEADNFGISVAIDNGTVVVGANFDDDNGSGSGSAYLFSASTGAQLHKLLPTDGEFNTIFGVSVAIDSGIVAVGASFDRQVGSAAGAVYLFHANTGAQLFKLLPNNASERLGGSVSISNGVVVAGGIFGQNADQSGFGSAYLFDASTGAQTSVLIASDGASNDRFGNGVSISNAVVVVGSPEDDDNGSSSGSAYIFGADANNDTDGDGLLDEWENNGIPYTDINGVEQRFMLPDADPNHKDLYVELDAMTGFSLSNGADIQLFFAFDNAPLDNPDGSNGITLHLLRDETTLPHVPVWDTDGCWPMDFDNFRNNSYGTFNERTNVNHTTLLEAKAKAYRYGIVADRADNPATPEIDAIGGCGSMPGDNFVIFIGLSNGGVSSDDGQAAIFMHELGHNLGLNHGGGDGVNGKPNYPSIMNYLLTYKTSWNDGFWSLDYSRADAANLTALNESSLNENESVGSANNLYKDYFMPFGVNVDNNGTTVREIRYLALDDTTTDLGDASGTMFQDGQQDPSVEQDLNYVTDPPEGVSLPSTPSPGQTLEPYDDWAHVNLGLLAGLSSSAAPPVFPTGELTEVAVAWMDTNFPPPPSQCLADLTGDGQLNFFDVSAFLAAFGMMDPAADFTSDGQFNFFDVSAFLVAFAAGCP